MERLMRLLAPRTGLGFVIRLVALVSFVALANLAFARFFDAQNPHGPQFYFMHALIVGGPLIAFFLAVTVFQTELQKRLYSLSRKDDLTGLNNRRSFLELTERRRAQKSKGVLLMMDADWFKKINDQHGHQGGDLALKSIANMLRRNVREHDTIGRLGGEEFAVYMHDMTIEQARAVGSRLIKPVGFTTTTGAHLTVTLSIGAVISQTENTLDEMINRADKALYRAKETGRGKLVVWDEIAPTPTS